MTPNETPNAVHAHKLVIIVNRKNVIPPHEQERGLAIKELAIAQGVPNVSIDFDLFLTVGADTQERIADDQVLQLRNGMEFRMIRPDHNS